MPIRLNRPKCGRCSIDTLVRRRRRGAPYYKGSSRILSLPLSDYKPVPPLYRPCQ
jgi:hypothetical protein